MNDRVHNRVTRPPPPHRRAAAKNRACRKLIIVSLACVVAIAARQFHFIIYDDFVRFVDFERSEREELNFIYYLIIEK